MLNKDLIVSLMSIMGDDMPYVISELDQKTQTVRKGSSFTCDTAIIANMPSSSWSIEYPDGYSITSKSGTVFTEQDITCFFPEGTKFVFNHPNSIEGTLFYFPLRKLGGVRVSSYHIVLHKNKPKKETLCH